jgi:ABC-type glycerol-3-phosphate transport system substrate-binding protein
MTFKTKGYLTLTGLLLASSAMAQDAVTLNIWSDTPRLDAFAAYDAGHDNVALNVTTVAPGDLVTKLQLAMQAGSDIPDVIFMSDIAFSAQLSTRRSNYLMDLTDAVPQALQDEFYPNSNAPCWVNGKLLCLRNDMAHMITWYNVPKLAELGATVPTTWEEFAALGATLGPQGYVMGSGVEPFPLLAFLVSGGCPIAIPVEGKEDTVHIDLTGPECLKAAQMVDGMIANGSLSKVGPFDPAFVELAKAGNVPLMIGPTWFGEYVIKPTYEWPAGVLAAAAPPMWEGQDQPLTWSWGGGTFGGWKDTAHPAEVVDVIEWMATDVTNQTTAVTLPAHAPSAVAWGANLNADGYYANDDVFQVQVDAAAYSHPGYMSIRIDVPGAIAKTLVTAVAAGQTIESALPALQEELVNLAGLNGYSVE